MIELIIIFHASKGNKQKLLGRSQGKHNVFEFLRKICVNNLKRFSAVSYNNSSFFKLNNKIIVNLKYLNLKAIHKKSNISSYALLGRRIRWTSFESQVEQICVNSSIIWSIIIKSWLIRYGVHPHPGPNHVVNKITNRCTQLPFSSFSF